MKLVIDMPKVRKSRVMLVSPMYGGLCSGAFTTSLLKLLDKFFNLGIPLSYRFLYNESLVPRARNRLAHTFMYSDCTHMLSIDSDIQFEAEDILNLLSLDYPISGALYAKKQVNWERVALAVKNGVPHEKLHLVSSSYVCNFSSDRLPLEEPVEVRHLGTGYLMVKKEVFEKIDAEMPHLRYTPMEDERSLLAPGNKGYFTDFFGCGPSPYSKEGEYPPYLSEDWMLAEHARHLGYKLMLAPWINSVHHGNYEYATSLRALGEAGLQI